MKLNFTGDLVYPEKDCININKIEEIFKNTNTLTNLEGQILSDKFETVDQLKYNILVFLIKHIINYYHYNFQQFVLILFDIF